MITNEFDTITAIATPLGEGAIGIVRISGSKALAIIKKIFKGKNLDDVPSHTINYGHIVENGPVLWYDLVDRPRTGRCHASVACPAERLGNIPAGRGKRNKYLWSIGEGPIIPGRRAGSGRCKTALPRSTHHFQTRGKFCPG